MPLTFPSLPRCRRAPWSALAALATSLTLLAAAPASAQVIDNPPLLPKAITIFPQRDFVSIEGFAPNADLLVQVLRGGVLSEATGRTDSSGLLEVNHPGGVCWNTVTPDIGPADVVQATYRATANNQAIVPAVVLGSGAAAVTKDVAASQAFDAGNGTVVVKGTARQPDGSPIPLANLEVRIINPDFRNPPASRITRRDIRADSTGGRVDGVPGGSGQLAYDTPGGINFTAVFTGLSLTERQLAVNGQTRIMGWQQTTAAGDRLGVTIYEVGEVGGPGIGGCPPGPGGAVPPAAPEPPVHYVPAQLLDATAPQPALVTVFPERDFVSIEGFPAGTELQVVVRRGTATAPLVVGTARGVVPAGGIFEVNHPGGVCWSGQTPDIVAGDWIDVFSIVSLTFSAGQKQQVIDTRVTKSATISSNTVQVVGRSVDPRTGRALALTLMEQRIINPAFVDTRIGRRDIRADTAGGRLGNVPNSRGLLVSTGSGGGTEWRATYSGLNATEMALAVAGQNRAMAWFSTNAAGDRFGVTISEFGEVGGPGFGGCPATGSATIPIP
ncbi:MULTISPECIES: hypothetical protein [Ramlibacter]|uniref:Uncharacterized protein n=1 Tax=Ramlibacter pinisoli TaxID=2682844 RepID=A0A6N8IZC9_9BURK|nr:MULTISPECIES: hypothetical protein [Ramlibacter]MBA2961979.1 hypothetical protein [Ramlibacter sp. CGMCC 1.13660]MVQ31922.1 hypothetical protein [Ramlibacter pinisoli]